MPKNKENVTEITKEVKFKRHDDRAMFLHTQWGTGEADGKEFSFGQVLPAGIYFRVKGDDRQVTVDLQSLVRAGIGILVDEE